MRLAVLAAVLAALFASSTAIAGGPPLEPGRAALAATAARAVELKLDRKARAVTALERRVRKLERRVDRLLTAKQRREARKRCAKPASIVVLGRCIQQRGYDVGEHPAFGGVSPVHSGPCHYEGRALDVNDGAGQSAAEMASLDRLDGWLEMLPRAWVLWRVAGHFDHLHVSYDCVG